MGLVSRPGRADVLNPTLEQLETQDPQVWIWGIILVSNMYPSRQRSKASPERQESKRPLFDPELNPLAQRAGAGQRKNIAQSHLKLPIPPAPMGQRDDISAEPFTAGYMGRARDPNSHLLTKSTEHS